MKITQQLQCLQGGDWDAMHRVAPLIYAELKRLARGRLRLEFGDDRLETTALVHETFLKLAGGEHLKAAAIEL